MPFSRVILFTCCCSLLLFQWSCNSDAIDLDATPVIEAVIPDSAYIGDIIKITGKNFSTAPSQMEVSFAGLPAKIMTATPTALEVKVPYEATGESGIKVAVNGLKAVSGFGFKVIPPPFSLYEMQPKEGSAGQTIHIRVGDIPSDLSKIKARFNETIEAEVSCKSFNSLLGGLKVVVPLVLLQVIFW